MALFFQMKSSKTFQVTYELLDELCVYVALSVSYLFVSW